MLSLSVRSISLLVAGVLFGATTAFAESAQEIVTTALEKYEQRLANVQTVSITQNVMGIEVETNLAKETVDGHATLVPTGDGAPGTDPGAFLAQMQEMAEAAKLIGKEKVGGVECWVLEMDDMKAFDAGPQPGGGDFDARRGRFWIDRKDYLMRKMMMEGDATNGGQTTPITMEMTLRDYRDTEGFLWPFSTDMVVRGIGSGMSEEERAEAKKALAEMEAQMAEMPESQRKMMESMMGGQKQKLEQMIESGEMKMTVQVTRLSVNGG